MESAAHHRKIELQYPEDLTYLIDNVKRAAAQRLDEAFPPMGQPDEHEEDQLRSQIETLIDEYISRTFQMAAPNLVINGLPVPTSLSTTTTTNNPAQPQTAYEPFDDSAHQHLLDLAREEEDLLAEIATLKRKVPSHVAARFADYARTSLETDDSSLCRVIDETKEHSNNTPPLENAVVGQLLERQSDIESAYFGVTDGLASLQREMPSVVAKMERARVAGEYVLSEGR